MVRIPRALCEYCIKNCLFFSGFIKSFYILTGRCYEAGTCAVLLACYDFLPNSECFRLWPKT